MAQDTFHGGTDALIVTGSGTGKSINVDELQKSEDPVLGFHLDWKRSKRGQRGRNGGAL